MIDKKLLKKILYKNYTKSDIFNKSYVTIKGLIDQYLFYILFFIFIAIILYFNFKKENYKNTKPKPIKKKEDIEEETYRVKNSSKLSENDFMFKYGKHLKRVTPIPKKYI